jgi:hypothetical protein
VGSQIYVSAKFFRPGLCGSFCVIVDNHSPFSVVIILREAEDRRNAPRYCRILLKTSLTSSHRNAAKLAFVPIGQSRMVLMGVPIWGGSLYEIGDWIW